MVIVVLLWIAVGVAIDTSQLPGGREIVILGTWLLLAKFFTSASKTEQLEIAVCVALGALGELFLIYVLGMYDYRLGGLPLFIPAGHGLVYACCVRIHANAPHAITPALLFVFSPIAIFLAATGRDYTAALWAPVLFLLIRSKDSRLYATAFVLGLAIELYGTSTGGWQYYEQMHFFDLPTTNPPLLIGSLYCILVLVTRLTACFLLRISAAISRVFAVYGHS